MGLGLTDCETTERLWTYLRPFHRTTQEMTPGHRNFLFHSWSENREAHGKACEDHIQSCSQAVSTP